MAANSPNSPRQKMINLMYLVFIALLALNVSSEVLDGFELVEESLLRSVKASTTRNQMVFDELDNYYRINPEKTEIWYNLADTVKTQSDSLFNFIQDLKTRIVKKADGKDGDPEHLKHPDDLNAALEIALDVRTKEAEKLKNGLNEYREFVTSLVTDSIKQQIIKSNLSTEPSENAIKNNKTWEESLFERMPLAAAVTILTKMQNDIRYAEGEVLSTLLKNVDVLDFRVNKVDAFVIPQSQIVMRGSNYNATIVLSAQDSTQRPKIFVNGAFLDEKDNGKYVRGAGAVGTFPVTGYIEMKGRDGTPSKSYFSTSYNVVEPIATIEATRMNVLYAGIENAMNFAFSGAASQNITPTMTNGTLSFRNNQWIAVPSKVGTDAVFTLSVKMPDGRTQSGSRSFRVRALPKASPYINYQDDKGNTVKFDKGRLAKSILFETNELKAAIDDGLLNIPFTVLRFELLTFDSMGNAMRSPSNGARFSPDQKELIRQLSRGKIVLVRGIVAKGPDGIEQEISPIEITIN